MDTRRCASILLGLLVLAAPAGAQCLDQELAPANPLPDARFGSAVAVAGDVAMVGAPSLGGPGSVSCYRRVAGEWVLTQELAGETGTFDQFGLSIALSTSRALVGSRELLGEVYAYEFDGAVWNQVQRIAPGVSTFGNAVAMDGDRAIIGAHGADFSVGAAFVYRLQGGAWVLEQQLEPFGDGSEGLLGESVALQGDLAVVGAPLFDEAFVYGFELGRWTGSANVELELNSSDFGSAVAIAGDEILVGAPDAESAAGGSVFFYRPNGALLGSLGHGGSLHDFGASLAVRGTTLLVGDPGIIDDGAARLFERLDGTWVPVHSYAPFGPFGAEDFGRAVALGDEDVWIGAPGSPELPGDGAGRAHRGPLAACSLAVHAIAPGTVPAFAPGGAATLTLQGSAFGLVDSITVGGVTTVLPDPAFDVSGTALSFDFALPADLGTVPVELASGAETASTAFDVVAAAPPALATASAVLSDLPFDVTMASEPRTAFVLFASPDLVPSNVPGVVELLVGDAFTSLFLLDVLPMPANGWLEQPFTVHQNGGLLNLDVHLQGVEVGTAAPYAASNVATFVWVI